LFSIRVSKSHTFLKFWLPPLAWMLLIFSFSSDARSYEHSSRLFEPLLRWLFPQMSAAHVDLLHHLFRKSCHVAEYAVLALLFWRAIHFTKNNLPAWSWPKVGGALLLVFLYASTDEFHQSFVPTRTALFSDVLIDTAGGALGLSILWLVTKIFTRKK
jgi:VanZ family protein